MATSQPEILPTRRSWLRRFRVPLIGLGTPALVFVLISLWTRFDWEPAAQMPLFMAFQITFILGFLATLIWWLFFSGFSWVTKLAVLVVVIALPFIGSLFIGEVEFKGNMTPIFLFGEKVDRAALLKQHRQENADTSGLPAIDLKIGPEDFPRYRGTGSDGRAYPISLVNDWAAKPPRVLWKQPCGGGYSGFAVAGNAAITLEQRDEEEVVVCYDRTTGKERWRFAYPAFFKHVPPMGGNGPRSTPTIAGGDVYSLGAKGDLICLNGTTGEKRWQTNILTDNGAKNVEWAMTGSPLVWQDRVIVNPGIDPENNAGKAVAAYSRKTGDRLWAAGNKLAGYSSPQLATLAGTEQIVLFDGAGLAGISLQDGTELWRFAWKTFSDMNIIQPLLLSDDRIFISSEAANGGVMLQVANKDGAWSVTELWKNRNLYSRFANPVAQNGHIYGLCNEWHCRSFVPVAAQRTDTNTLPCLLKMPR